MEVRDEIFQIIAAGTFGPGVTRCCSHAIYNPLTQAIDVNGDPISGAKLLICDEGTTWIQDNIQISATDGSIIGAALYPTTATELSAG